MARDHLSKLRILKYPAAVLRKMCRSADFHEDDIEAIACRMLELMHEARGVGLAAPQVGVSIRLFVWNVGGDRENDRICVNPRLLLDDDAEDKEEGCLSLPGVSVTVRRSRRAVLHGFDATGKPFEERGEDLIARVWQHEQDHLEGRLIIDRMSTADEIANRRALRQLEEAAPRKRGR